MVRTGKKWRMLPSQGALSKKLGQEVGVSPIVAQVLINRGICDAASAERFLNGGAEGLLDPWLLRGMKEAVGRIETALAQREKITIYGDYDVDGITATALMYRVLRRLGADVEYYIPERQSEGYGLNAAALELLSSSGTKLIITVDCGINAVAEVASVAGRLDVIITDHHQPPDVLPKAYAVINPKQSECLYPDKQLAGVGVAFKLCQALWQSQVPADQEITDFLDLVAIGTIADIVPLTDENRIIVKQGLDQLSVTANLGLKALIKASGLIPDGIDAGKVGYTLAPRLNAAGRLSHAAAGVELLVTDDQARAIELATELNNENIKRQAVEKELLAAAEKVLAESNLAGSNVLVLAGENWHPGVIGIVASRLVDKYYRPVVMISIRDGIGKGSCRSIPGFDMYQALVHCSDLLIQFGGHKQAAGLSIAEANIDAFRDKLSALAGEWLSDEDYLPVISIDSEVALAEINAAFVGQLACLAPHGMGNPSPVFTCKGLALTDMRPLGQEGRHFRLKVKQDIAVSDVLAWNLSGMTDALEVNDSIDLAFVAEFNDWQGRRSVQLRARDLKAKQPIPQGLILTDSRNTTDKIAYIMNLAGKSQKVLVYTNSRRQSVILARRLRRQQSLAEGRLARHYPALDPVAGQRTLDDWKSGKFKVLVSEVSLASGKPEADHVILCQPPLTCSSLARRCSSVVDGVYPVNLHFLYGAAEIISTAENLTASFPDRNLVGRVYLVLKGLAASNGGRVALTDTALVRKVAQVYRALLDEDGAAAALKILEEIDLLTMEICAGRRIIQLKEEPAEKKDIEQSYVYRECTKARSTFPKWSRDIMMLTVAALWKRAVN